MWAKVTTYDEWWSYSVSHPFNKYQVPPAGSDIMIVPMRRNVRFLFRQQLENLFCGLLDVFPICHPNNWTPPSQLSGNLCEGTK